MLEYIQLIITFCVSILVSIGLFVAFGFWGGITGCLLISMHNVWAGNLILSSGWRTKLNNFLLNMLVTVSILLPIQRKVLL